jgi:hypothetical protein
VFGGSTVSAQRGMGGPADQNIQSSYYARNEFEKKMQHDIVCTCGSCGHATIAECRSRKPQQATGGTPIDSSLEERIDDELRELD